ncbi:hypothetical protein C8Q77DRAFT_1154272 [Trametes polyzona]|nr:hypothetical protein C8Q77DRAFT_1154272 [Trametes polyzona]
MQSGINPVVPSMPMSGALPTAGNPFPAPAVNVGMGAPDPAPPPMGMPEPVIPGQAQNPEAPVIPPLPHSLRGRNGTPYHHADPYPLDSSDSESYDDELTPRTRERLQPPLAPGQYGPFDRSRDRRGTPAPALRRHRRAESSPAFGQNPPPPVIPPPGMMYGQQPQPIPPPGMMYGQQPQPTFPGQGPIYPPPEPVYCEPSPIYRPRPWSPLQQHHNPLPPPPKDILQQSPYARLLHELRKPIDEREIKEKMFKAPAIHTVGAIPIPLQSPQQFQGTRSSREKKRKGIFRSLSSRLHHRRDDDEFDLSPPNITAAPLQAFVGGQSTAIYPVAEQHPDGSTTLTYFPPAVQPAPNTGGMPMAGGGQPTSAAGVVPPVMPGYVPSAAPAVSPGVIPAASGQTWYQPRNQNQSQPPNPRPHSPNPRPRSPNPRSHSPHPRSHSPNPPPPPPHERSPGPMRMPTSQPAPPTRPQLFRFYKDDAHFAGLLHTAPYRVHYNHKSYPTVVHLIEALRFRPEHPEEAEAVRRCGTPEEAQAYSASRRFRWRRDLKQVMDDLMDEAMYAKFIQHERLRALLFETGDGEIEYVNPDDLYWGTGEDFRGMNQLGLSLRRVRDRLRAEGADS